MCRRNNFYEQCQGLIQLYISPPSSPKQHEHDSAPPKKKHVLYESVERVLVRLKVDDISPELIQDPEIILIGIWVLCIRYRDVVAEALCHRQGLCLLEVDGQQVADC